MRGVQTRAIRELVVGTSGQGAPEMVRSDCSGDACKQSTGQRPTRLAASDTIPAQKKTATPHELR